MKAGAVLAPVAALALLSTAHAGAPVDAAISTGASNSRYGLFDWLDHNSVYGKGVFPEPFLVDDSDLEVNEFRLDYLHTSAGSAHSNVFSVEYEKGFGPVTVEVKLPYERDSDAGTISEGTDNISFGIRAPIYQYVSPSGFVDNTVGVSFELGIPTHSTISHNTEIVPAIFDDLKVGNFTVQAIVGYSSILGSGGGADGDHGLHVFEYGVVLGYTIPHDVLSIPGVQNIVPVFELSGETQLNKSNAGQNALLATIGFRANMKAMGPLQPRLGIGVVLPLDDGGRADTHWGLATSFVFEF